MTWIIVGVVLIVVAVAGAHWLLSRWSRAAGQPIVAALLYTAAVVLACQLTDMALGIDQLSLAFGDLGNSVNGEAELETKAAVQLIAKHLADIGWQCGLLGFAAVIVAVLRGPANPTPLRAPAEHDETQ